MDSKELRWRHTHTIAFGRPNRCLFLCLVALLLTASLVPELASAGDSRHPIGIYVHETMEGHFVTAAVSATVLANELQDSWGPVIICDRVPLESNESMRLLGDATKNTDGRVDHVRVWLIGGSLVADEVTSTDDTLTYRDLTWHLDMKRIEDDARRRGLSAVLVGTLEGFRLPPVNRGQRLESVQVRAQFRRILVQTGEVTWGRTLSETGTGFRQELAFGDACERVGHSVAKLAQQTLK